MNQPNISNTPKRDPYRVSSYDRPVEEDDIQMLLDLMKAVYRKTGEPVPSDAELRANLPKTIKASEYRDIRSHLKKASNHEELAQILARLANQYGKELQAVSLKKLKNPIQTTQEFLGRYGTELAEVLSKTSSKSDFIGANTLKRNQILAVAVARWANQKGLDALSMEPILQILREGGVEYLQGIVKAAISDAQPPFGFSDAFKKYAQKVLPKLIDPKNEAVLYAKLLPLLQQEFPQYVDEMFIAPSEFSPAFKVFLNHLIQTGAITTDMSLEETQQALKKALQDGVWNYGLTQVKATSSIRQISQPLKTALSSQNPNAFDQIPQELEKILQQILSGRLIQASKATPPVDALIQDIIKIAVTPHPNEDAPIEALKKAIQTCESTYFKDKGYSAKAQAYFRQILDSIESPDFWQKTPEERANLLVESSQGFLSSYVNPKMSRRGFLEKVLPKPPKEVKPLIPKDVGETALTRRAIPTFLSLNTLFKWLGKVPKG